VGGGGGAAAGVGAGAKDFPSDLTIVGIIDHWNPEG
jgi:microcompartment protein CcmK/EutM